MIFTLSSRRFTDSVAAATGILEGVATAGTGDVLAGILVSLLSQGYSRLEASLLGTYLHAEAANYYMNYISKDGLTASDLIDCIPHAFNALRKND